MILLKIFMGYLGLMLFLCLIGIGVCVTLAIIQGEMPWYFWVGAAFFLPVLIIGSGMGFYAVFRVIADK